MEIKLLLILINVTLTLLIAWVAMEMLEFSLFTPDYQEANQIEEVYDKKRSVSRKDTSKIDMSYTFLTAKDIFQTSTKPPQALPAANVKAPETPQAPKAMPKLTLIGTAIGEGGQSFAIIMDEKRREQSLFYVNDSVSGVRVEEVHADRVVLSFEGKREVLPLAFEPSPAIEKRRAPASRVKPRSRVPELPPEPEDDSPDEEEPGLPPEPSD